jgi:hypothetical protein
VTRLQSLIGCNALLLHWPLGSKGAPKKWKHLTLDVMSDPAYVAKLGTGNIGVAQGDVSNGICSIDLDIDGEVEGFLALNPKLTTSLRTKGQRGCNVWFRTIGELTGRGKSKQAMGRYGGSFAPTVRRPSSTANIQVDAITGFLSKRSPCKSRFPRSFGRRALLIRF